MKIHVVSGYFDPVHDGHIELFEKSKEGADKLIVILNNDLQTSLKKGKPFMEEKVRKKIIEAIRYVDEVFLSIDTDRSVCKSLRTICRKYPADKLIFINGGDRRVEEVPEYAVSDEPNLILTDGAGEKINSSRKYYQNSEK